MEIIHRKPGKQMNSCDKVQEDQIKGENLMKEEKIVDSKVNINKRF